MTVDSGERSRRRVAPEWPTHRHPAFVAARLPESARGRTRIPGEVAERTTMNQIERRPGKGLSAPAEAAGLPRRGRRCAVAALVHEDLARLLDAARVPAAAPTASAEAIARGVELGRVGRLLNDAVRAIHVARGRPERDTLNALRRAADAVTRQLGRWPCSPASSRPDAGSFAHTHNGCPHVHLAARRRRGRSCSPARSP